jgi:hypothetical protein
LIIELPSGRHADTWRAHPRLSKQAANYVSVINALPISNLQENHPDDPVIQRDKSLPFIKL